MSDHHHYPALDGLRGIAVLGVMLFHANAVLVWRNPVTLALNTGWLGVDVFFVISGFLITGILLDTRGDPSYFRSFYLRRLLRIVPAYYSLLAIIFFVLPNLLPFHSDGLKLILHRQGWIWAHLTNMSFVRYDKVWTQADWLDMNHLWSLAVEEQFYLVFPLVVYFTGAKRLRTICIVCIAGSQALRIALWLAGQRNGAIYFPTPCRLDGLALGALGAIIIRTGTIAQERSARWFSFVGLAGLTSVWLFRGSLSLTDKFAAVFAVTLAGLFTLGIILLVTQPTRKDPLTAFLSHPLLRGTGRYSYGLYLIHGLLLRPLATFLPPIRLIEAVGSEALGNLAFLVLFLAGSFGLALISWHANEKHWLRSKARLAVSVRATPSMKYAVYLLKW